MPLCFLYLLFLLCLKARHALGTVCISMDYGDYARLYVAVRDCARLCAAKTASLVAA